MDRRTILLKLLGRNKQAIPIPKLKTNSALSCVTGLTPYTGTFGEAEAAHLLRRATMGATKAHIQDAVTQGLEATVTQLLSSIPAAPLPINFSDTLNPNLPIGVIWQDVPYHNGIGVGHRNQSLRAWYLYHANQPMVNIREKMTLFWHNHFAVEKAKVGDAKYLYKYIDLLRTNCLGDFRQLVKDITIDKAVQINKLDILG